MRLKNFFQKLSKIREEFFFFSCIMGEEKNRRYSYVQKTLHLHVVFVLALRFGGV
jgi:hypothetical protein